MIALILLASSVLSLAASFDCEKATTPQEKAICSDQSLSRADDDLAKAYTALRSRLSETGKREVQEDQRAWLAWLKQRCQQELERMIRNCLTQEYSTRLSQLQPVQTLDGWIFFSRLKVVATPNREKPPGDSSFPDHGYGNFSWPELDIPTSQQALWNSSVRTYALKGSVPVDVEGAEVQTSYQIKVVNSHFLSVEFHNYQYNYGAAHGTGVSNYFAWWLDRGRVPRASDTFRMPGGWEKFISAQSISKLESGTRAEDLFKPELRNKAVPDVISEVKNWSPDSEKLEIVFPVYSVGPYSAGEFNVDFRWNELRAYLAQDFDPLTLPRPLPPPAKP